MSLLTTKYFLMIGGAILLALGIFGFIVPEPVTDTSAVHFDVWENYIRTLAGIGMLVGAFLLPRIYRWLASAVVGLTAIAFTIIGFVVSGAASPNLGGANLENPFDNLVHLAIGLYALATVVLSRSDVLKKPEIIEAEAERKREEPPKMPKAA